ncbi:MAG: hypothetical protein ACE14Q_07905 [Acidobacteriota bacterium]
MKGRNGMFKLLLNSKEERKSVTNVTFLLFLLKNEIKSIIVL